jgi:hypothetical protein
MEDAVEMTFDNHETGVPDVDDHNLRSSVQQSLMDSERNYARTCEAETADGLK